MLSCTNCGAASEDATLERCPKCLRRSSLVAREEGRGGSRVAWPTGPACPLCLERDAGRATFYVGIRKSRIGMLPGDVEHAFLRVRYRSCDACHAAIVRLGRLRRIAVVSLVTCLVGCALAVTYLAGVAMVAVLVVCLTSVAVAFGAVYVENGRLRRPIEDTTVFRHARERATDPGGLVTQEGWQLWAEIPGDRGVVDASELA